MGRYVEAWRALIEARDRGLVREIGVCNFLPEHIERLAQETGVLPVVNQIELHPHFPPDLLSGGRRLPGPRGGGWPKMVAGG